MDVGTLAGKMTYTAYLDNIRAKTGRDAESFRKEAAKLGLTTHAELLHWLKSGCGLGHGHSNAIILYIRHPEIARAKIDVEARGRRKAQK